MGRFGITGKSQTQPILQLSDGLRSRLVFAWLAYKTPHILALVHPQTPKVSQCDSTLYTSHNRAAPSAAIGQSGYS